MAQDIKAGRMAYIVEDYLTPTTTFVTKEIQYFYHQGYDIQVYVAGSPAQTEIDPAVEELLSIAQYSRPTGMKAMALSHLAALTRRPARYLRTLWTLLRTTWTKPRMGIRTLRHFLDGVYLGEKMASEGVKWSHAHFAGRAATAAWVVWHIYGIPYSITTHAYDLYTDFNNPHESHPDHSSQSAHKPFPFLKLKFDDAQTIITISDFNLNYLVKQLGIEPDKIELIRYSIDTSRFHREMPPTNDKPIIMSVGQLVEKKGHDVLLRACADLKSWGYSFECNIIGAGPLLQELTALRDDLGLKDDVHFRGHIHHSELPTYHREADVFALACVRAKNGNMDGIPLAIQEAMAMSIPVVTTKVSGIPELILNGDTGFIVEPGDPKAVSEHLKQLLDDAQLRKEIGSRGREKIQQEYNQAKNLPMVADTICQGMARAT